MSSLAGQDAFMHSLPFGWLMAAIAGLMIGVFAGAFHFWSLRIVTRRFVDGDLFAVALQVLRFGALGLVLFALSLAGAIPLIAATAGIVLARSYLLGRLGGMP